MRSTSGWGRDREICPMIFGIKIWRLDFFVTFLIKEKSKDFLETRLGCDSEICPMIFGIKIFRLDFLFLLYQDKRKIILKQK